MIIAVCVGLYSVVTARALLHRLFILLWPAEVWRHRDPMTERNSGYFCAWLKYNSGNVNTLPAEPPGARAGAISP